MSYFSVSLELGAGGGLVGLAVASGCSIANPLYITDQVEMHSLMEHNIGLNDLGAKVKAAVLNWSVSCPLLFPLTASCIADSDLRAYLQHFMLIFYMKTRGEPLTQDVVALKPDVILAADCVYFEPAFPLLLTTLSDLLELCPSATIFFCFMKRRRADMQFLKTAKRMFNVSEVADDDRPVFSREGLFLYTFTRRT
ncbi:hypothetical protein F5B20DRAFT_521635 [Whalleya microplaca]|nr:hypothetical protein F5B20DRAFT_521635 [Whalleya microplaca]